MQYERLMSSSGRILCIIGVVLASEYLIFSSRKLWPPPSILITEEVWGEKEIRTKGMSGGKKFEKW